MAEVKTKPTTQSVASYLNAIDDEARRKDCRALAALMKRVTGCAPTMWGTSIVGFGRYEMTYASGKTLDWPLVGFASRKGELVLYIMPGFARYEALLKKLGPHRTGKSCLYVKRLSDLDRDVLEALVAASVKAMAPKRVRASPGA